MNGTVTAAETVEEAHEEAALEAKDQQLDGRWSHHSVELGTDNGEYRIVRPKIRQLLNSGLILRLVVFFSTGRTTERKMLANAVYCSAEVHRNIIGILTQEKFTFH